MQAAHSSNNWFGLPFASEVGAVPAPRPVAVAGVLLVAMFATVGAFDPPQPAERRTRHASSATPQQAVRGCAERFIPGGLTVDIQAAHSEPTVKPGSRWFELGDRRLGDIPYV